MDTQPTTPSKNNHQAKIVEITEPADGLLAVRVRCCGDPSTDSIVTIHELHRDPEEFDKDVANHCARVEKLHAARNHAKAHIARLKSR